jgi:DNA (cytosine-5)-methyltransferase 1
MTKTGYRAISLFSNCGAGDLGYAKAGFNFDVMAELDPRRLEVCLLNHPRASGVPGDLRKTWKEVVEIYRTRAGKYRPALLAACPPCQGLSSARGNRGCADDPDAGCEDERNLLVTVIIDVALALQPRIIVVENVPAFFVRQIRHPNNHNPISAANLLVEGLRQLYQVFPIITDLADFGVPQTRKRGFLTFVRRDMAVLRNLSVQNKAPYPQPTHASDYRGKPITLKQALARYGLPSLDAASKKNAISKIGRGLHSVPIWSDRRYDMVAAIPPDTGRSAWQNNVCPCCDTVQAQMDNAVCTKCGGILLRPIVKAANGRFRLIKGFMSSSYCRMKSDAPASTITTASGHIGSDLTIHPFENRVLSAFECARLQGFPARFKWGDALKKWGPTNVRDMIGEAVPPRFTESHGRVLRLILRDSRLRNFISNDDYRCTSGRQKLGLKGSSIPLAKKFNR